MLNIFLFNNKKTNARRFLYSSASKLYEACHTKNHLGGQGLYRTPDFVKKRRMIKLLLETFKSKF